MWLALQGWNKMETLDPPSGRDSILFPTPEHSPGPFPLQSQARRGLGGGGGGTSLWGETQFRILFPNECLPPLQMRVMAVGVASPSATPFRNETCSYASTGQQKKSNGYIRYMYSTCTVVGGHRQLFWLGYQKMKGIIVSP